MTEQKAKINFDEIPAYKQRGLFTAVLESTRAALAAPGGKEDFERWLKERKEREEKGNEEIC